MCTCMNSPISRSIFSFVIAPIFVGAAVFSVAGWQQRPSTPPPSGGASEERTTSYQGKPVVNEPGSDTEFKGPPPTGQGSQLPPGTGYSNAGGAVDPAALQQAAAGGVHYHVHYHGVPGSMGYVPGPAPGYAGTTYVNPANQGPVVDPNALYGQGYGAGNPPPLGSGGPNDGNAFVGSHTYTGFSGYGAYGNYFGGPGNYFGGYLNNGGGVGGYGMAWNAAAYNGAGYVAGFND